MLGPTILCARIDRRGLSRHSVGMAVVLFGLERRGPHPAGPRNGLVIGCEYRGRCMAVSAALLGFGLPGLECSLAPFRLTRLVRYAPRRAAARFGSRIASPNMMKTMPTAIAMAATPKATTEVNSDACRNEEVIAVLRLGSSRSSSA